MTGRGFHATFIAHPSPVFTHLSHTARAPHGFLCLLFFLWNNGRLRPRGRLLRLRLLRRSPHALLPQRHPDGGTPVVARAEKVVQLRLRRGRGRGRVRASPLLGLLLALQEAAFPQPRHLHVQRGHTVLQRGVPARADRDRRGQGEEMESLREGLR